MKNAEQQRDKFKMVEIVDKYLQDCKGGIKTLDFDNFCKEIQQTNKSFNSPVKMKDNRAAATEVYVAGQWCTH